VYNNKLFSNISLVNIYITNKDMADPEKFAIIVADIKDDKITNAQFKITDDEKERPNTTTGYSPIDITDLATASATASTTAGPGAVPGAVPITASPTVPSAAPSKTENSWPKELEPATYENLQNKGIFYLVKSDGSEVADRKKITIIDLLKKISTDFTGTELKSHDEARTKATKESDAAKDKVKEAEKKVKEAEKKVKDAEQKVKDAEDEVNSAAAAKKDAAKAELEKTKAESDAAKAELDAAKAESDAAAKVLAKYNTNTDYKTGIENLLFRKVDIVKVQRTAVERAAYLGTMLKKAVTRENTIPKEIQVDFKIPGKINTTIKTTVTTEGKFDDPLKVEISGVASLEGEYVIYKPVDINVFDLANLVSDSKDPDQEQIGEALNLITTSTSGGAKKSSKKNNLKTKNRRNKLSKRKTLKRITRKIKRT